MGAHKNCLIRTVLLSTHDICFGWEIRKKQEMCPWNRDAPAIAKFPKILNFHKQMAITPEGMMWYGPFYIMVLNNVTKFHKVLLKTIQLREQMLLQTVNLHKRD